MGFRVWGFQGVGFRIFGVRGSGFGVSVLGLGFQGSGF